MMLTQMLKTMQQMPLGTVVWLVLICLQMLRTDNSKEKHTEDR
jgi:hypothetical protein